MPEYYSYASVAALRRMNTVAASDLSDDDKYIERILAAGSIIDEITHRKFVPFIGTSTFDWQKSDSLSFNNDGEVGLELLLFNSLTDGNSNVIPSNAIEMIGGRNSDPTLYGPWWMCNIDRSISTLSFKTTKTRCISVNGTWGWHDNWTQAFGNVYTDNILSTSLQLNGGINSSVASITLSTDPTVSYNNLFASPGISAGNVIQIDQEWMLITHTVAASDIVNVVRGLNGSVATSHLSTTPLTVYRPPNGITSACLRIAQWLVFLDNAPFGKTLTPSMGQVDVPSAMPPDIKTRLAPYIRGVL